jgi:hypothetical protein
LASVSTGTRQRNCTTASSSLLFSPNDISTLLFASTPFSVAQGSAGVS